MNLRTLSAVLLAAPAFADEIRMKIIPSNYHLDKQAEQIRIFTQLDPTCTAIGEPNVIGIDDDGKCQEKQSLFKGDDMNNCCMKGNLKNEYYVWEDKMNYYHDSQHWTERVDHLFEDGVCFENWNRGGESIFLPRKETYNIYMVQYYRQGNNGNSRRQLGRNDKSKKNSDEGSDEGSDDNFEIDQLMVDFPCQKIKAIIFDSNKLKWTDSKYSDGGEKFYKDVRNNYSWARGLEPGNGEGFAVNCPIGTDTCDALSSAVSAASAASAASSTCASKNDSPAVEDVNVGPNSCTSRGWGDPHMVTWDGLRYDVHVHGELIFAKSLDPNSSFQIQARTEPVKNHPAKPAVTTGLVITDDNMPKIQVSMPRDEDDPCTEVINGCPVELYVDDVLRKPSHGSGSDKAKVDVRGRRITVQYPGASQIKVVMDVTSWRNECHFSVTYTLGTCRDDIVGLLGSPDGEWRNDWMDTSGNPLSIPSDLRRGSGFAPTMEYARDNWCVPNEPASNFAYEHDTSFDTYDICDNPNVGELASAVDNADEAIKKACHGDIFCVLDTVAFADPTDTTEVQEVIDTFNNDEGLHHELKQTQAADIEIVEQVPEDLGNANCPTCKAVGWGDPHIVTFDGLSYDVHVKGELTFLKSLDPENDFTIQARTVAVKNHRKGPAVTTAVVVHEDSRLGLPDIQVSLGQDANSELATEFSTGRNDKCYVQLFVDKEVKSILGGSGTTGASVQVNGNRIVVEYPSTNLKLDIKVTSWRNECHFSVNYWLVDCRCDETLIGILGQPDSPKDWTNDWHDHDGNAVTIPSRRSDRRGKKAYDYSRTWCITAGESHFAYEPNMSHGDFDECTGATGDDNFEIDIGAIIEEFENTTPEVIAQCTMDGDDEPDEGCLVDCFFGGEDACNEFTDTVATVIAETQTETIEFPPEPEITLEVPDTPPAGGDCPVCKAVGWGDPHIITFDGVTYDVHVKGELTFLKSLGARDFTIQARTAIVSNHPKGPAVTTGVVVYETGQPTIQVSLGSSSNSELVTMFGQCPVQLFVNGVATDIDAGTGLSDATVQTKGKRIVVEYLNTQIRLDMDVKVWRNTCHFSVTYYLADCPCDGSLVGILGQPDGEWSNDWHEHDGTAVSIPTSNRERRGKKAYDYSLTWCLTAPESYFTYEPTMGHSDHDFCTGSKGDDNFDVDIDEIIEEASPEIITKCTVDNELDEGCVVECVYLGDGACDEYLEIVQNTATATITEEPTSGPTPVPTSGPTPVPTTGPTPVPTTGPTPVPTSGPTPVPTSGPTPVPTSGPTPVPTSGPTPVPTSGPTPVPTSGPTPLVPALPDDIPDVPEDTYAISDTEISDQSDAGSQGDPHFKTWRNEHFEYHGQCDLVLAKDPNFAEGLGFDVQIRTKLVRFWSYIKSAAIRIGNDVFEVEGDAEGTLELRYWMNLEFQGPLETIGGFPIIFNGRDNNANKKIVQIDLSSKYPGAMIEIQVWKEFVKVDFKNPSLDAFGNAVGMLGDFKTGKTLARDGVTEIDDFHKFGNEWQVLPTDLMLFHDAEAPQFPKKCVEPEDPRGERRRRLEESSVSVEDAEKACASLTDDLDRKDCVYDIVATQDMAMAGAY